MNTKEQLAALQDRVEQALLQVMLAGEQVSLDAGELQQLTKGERGSTSRHQEATHYLVDKDRIDALNQALADYKRINQEFLSGELEEDATPSTPEM
jgi:hypothetical protein